MFIPLDFTSANSIDDLCQGEYRVVQSFYAAEHSSLRAVLFEYSRVDAGEPAACDLVVLTDEGTVVRARDFVWLPDRSWRDSDGVRANSLSALLPSEVLSLRLVRSEPGEAFVLE